jgi:phenylacetate-CoA ligase
LPAVWRRGLYFGLQRRLGSRVAAAWKEFQAWDSLDRGAHDAKVEQRLGRTLDLAVVQSEYYRALDLRRRPGESAGEFLERFPILSRELVRSDFTRLVIDPLRDQIQSPASVARGRYGWTVVKTGGTTGNPTSVVHDARGRDWGRATRIYSARQCGHPIGTPFFRLWGSEPDLLQIQASLQLRVMMSLLGVVPMNAFRAKAAELRHHAETMLAHPHIQSMMAYVDAAASLATFIQDRGLPRPRLRTIMACAGTVTPESRRILAEVFQAEVFDKYGSRDCCDMACECTAHNGLHVYSPNVFLEIIDERGRRCGPGVIGQVLVTLLNNPSFPMIRYQIGDMAQWAAAGPCACGVPYPRIERLEGRADDMLTTEDGTRVSSVFVRHFVGVSLNRQLIREWQLEQTGARKFVFRYVPVSRDGLDENVGKLLQSFQLAFGRSTRVEALEVDQVALSPTGKMRWIINRVANADPPHGEGAGKSA